SLLPSPLPNPSPATHIPIQISSAVSVKMSGAEAEETQSVVEDGGQGPGAPTPLTVLEVIIATDHSDWKL
ncbi:MAG: hypothetical protein Q9198_010317, partial [Flavoplaca austrocitrina]